MKLNNDAVRDILLCIEESVNYNSEFNYVTHGEIVSKINKSSLYNKYDILYAMEVLLTTEYLNLVEKPIVGADGELILAKIKGLTFSGCNFLDDIRKPVIWEIVKKKAKAFGEESIIALGAAGAELSKALLTNPNAINNFLEGIDNIKKYYI